MDQQLIKNPKGKHVKSGQKLMAYNLYIKHFKSASKTQAVKQTALEVGLGVGLMWNIVKEMEASGTVISPKRTRVRTTIHDGLEEFEKSAIRRHVHAFFFKNELPNLEKVLHAVNCDDSLPNFSRMSLYRVLKKLGFKYEKRSRKTILIEKPEIVLWRRRYLTAIKKYRAEGKRIYFTDETWVNAGHVKNKVWKDMTVTTARQALFEGLSTGIRDPSGKGKRLIVAHMGSDMGFVDGAYLNFQSKKTGDYHEDMNGEVYTSWLDGVLPLLENNSVIVLDNAPYHSVKADKVPNQSWRKEQICDWLNAKCIEANNELLKVELLALVKQYSLAHPAPYVIDEMVKRSGRTVLRLPPYHCNLNPIELIWAQVKNYVATNNSTFKINDVKVLLDAGVASISRENWVSCINHIIKEEERMWGLDGIAEELIEQVMISLDSDSTTEDEGTSDDDDDMGVDTL